jgi:protein-tyrosine kinase
MLKNKKLLGQNKLDYDYIYTKENPISFITEAHQKFLVNLEFINVDKAYKSIQITSSLSSEGKSTFLSNVAYLLGQKGLKVILVDLDLRKPKVHRIINKANEDGITEVLTEKISLEKAIKKDTKLGFDALVSGEKASAVVNLLQSKKMKTLFSDLKKLYDYILVDSPPVINVSDALYIAQITDATVFAISQQETKRSVAKEAINLLKQSNVNVIGAVATQVDIRKNAYGYGYGYGYGYNYTYEQNDND